MKLLFLIDHLYLHGGAEKVLTERCSFMADVLGFDVTILTTEQRGRPVCYPLSEKVRLVDIAVNYYRNISYFHPSNLVKVPGHFKRLNRQIREIEPQVIISLNYAFDFYWLPFVFKKTPKWKEFHGSRFFDMQARKSGKAAIKFAINDFIEARFDKLILLNPGEIEFFRTDNTLVIPNPVTVLGHTAKLESRKVVSAGRMTYIKGFDYLIEAWAIVSKELPDWELHIYGDGDPDYSEKLIHLAAASGLENIFIHGATDALQDVLLDSSVYAMASQTECFPMVLLESLSVGLPVVSFDCPTGPRHIVNDTENGFLVPLNDTTALAGKLLELMKNQPLRKEMGRQAKESALRFNRSVIMELWAHHLRKQVESGTGRHK